MELAAGTIKKVTLELGGKSPNIVFPDADLDEAVNGSLFAIYANAGQRCTARTRLFLHTSIYDDFTRAFVDKARKIRVGDPLDFETQMGPVISPQQRDRVLNYCQLAVEDGAELLVRRQAGDDGRAGQRQLRRADRLRQCPIRHATGPGGGLRTDPRGICRSRPRTRS